MNKKPIGYIYKITSPFGKIYIGQKTSNVFVESYWSSSQNPEFWEDLEKYGKENFTREILEWCYTKDELNKKEVYYIEKYSSMKSQGGYNLTKCFPNIEWTDNMKKVHSEREKKYFSIKENRIKRSISVKNSLKYQESRKTVGKAISNGKINSLKKKQTYAFTQTEEFKDKCRQKNKNRKWYNNGIIQVFCKECPEGFNNGMLPRKEKIGNFSLNHKLKLSKARQNKHWWNNGIISTFSENQPGPEWVKGRLLKKGINKWWNNGKIETRSKESPGKDYIEGRLKLGD